MHRFKELKLWLKSRDLCIEIYKLTKKFPKEEIFCLTQIDDKIIEIQNMNYSLQQKIKNSN